MSVMSMTGFGRGEAREGGHVMTVELKSVNHRFLDLSFRMPRALNEFEDAARKALQKQLARGHVDIAVKYENEAGDSTQVQVNEALLGAYLAAYGQVSKRFRLRNDVRLSTLARREDIFRPVAAPQDAALLGRLLQTALADALAKLCAVRGTEGAHLRDDIIAKLEGMLAVHAQLEERAPLVVEEYRARLKARIAELMEAGTVDEARLGAEVALFADRCAIDEELVRLRSHITKLKDMLRKGGTVGRQADFVVQEMNREVNTICSKSQDLTITEQGLFLKGEVEKIREQVQNLE